MEVHVPQGEGSVSGRAVFSWWRPGAQPGHNLDLKSGGTKLEAPRIEMPKALRGMMNREGHPSQPTRGSMEVIKLYNNVKYGER